MLLLLLHAPDLLFGAALVILFCAALVIILTALARRAVKSGRRHQQITGGLNRTERRKEQAMSRRKHKL